MGPSRGYIYSSITVTKADTDHLFKQSSDEALLRDKKVAGNNLIGSSLHNLPYKISSKFNNGGTVAKKRQEEKPLDRPLDPVKLAKIVEMLCKANVEEKVDNHITKQLGRPLSDEPFCELIKFTEDGIGVIPDNNDKMRLSKITGDWVSIGNGWYACDIKIEGREDQYIHFKFKKNDIDYTKDVPYMSDNAQLPSSKSKALFQRKDFFISHSGKPLSWKIECDTLTDDDWAWAASHVASKFSFRGVHGIPSGGVVFEKHLRKYINPKGDFYLIVDDVLTTGNSMEKAKKDTQHHHSDIPRIGVVLFAREKPAHWIAAIWQLWLGL